MVSVMASAFAGPKDKVQEDVILAFPNVQILASIGMIEKACTGRY